MLVLDSNTNNTVIMPDSNTDNNVIVFDAYDGLVADSKAHSNV